MSNDPIRQYDDGYTDPISGQVYVCRKLLVRQGAVTAPYSLKPVTVEYKADELDISAADVSNDSFGVAIATKGTGTVKARIERVRVKVRYFTRGVQDVGPSNPFRNKGGNGFFDAKTVANGRIVVCGDRGRILYSDNKGATWIPAVTGTIKRLWSLSYKKPNVGYVAAQAFPISDIPDRNLLSTGIFYSRSGDPPLALSGPTITCVGAGGIILRSEDNGTTWSTTYYKHIESGDWYHVLDTPSGDVYLHGANGRSVIVGPVSAGGFSGGSLVGGSLVSGLSTTVSTNFYIIRDEPPRKRENITLGSPARTQGFKLDDTPIADFGLTVNIFDGIAIGGSIIEGIPAFGYFFSGSTVNSTDGAGAVANTDLYTFPTSVVSAATALAVAKKSGYAFGNATHGMLCGGVNSASEIIGTTEKRTYTNDTTAAAAVLPETIYRRPCGAATAATGYGFYGRRGAGTLETIVRKYNFSSDSWTDGGALGTTSENAAAAGNTTKAFIIGNGGVSFGKVYTYASDTMANAAYFRGNDVSGSGQSSATTAVFNRGGPTTDLVTITFSDEVEVFGASLPAALYRSACITNRLDFVFGGGSASTGASVINTIRKYVLASNTMTTPSAVLSSARTLLAAASGAHGGFA